MVNRRIFFSSTSLFFTYSVIPVTMFSIKRFLSFIIYMLLAFYFPPYFFSPCALVIVFTCPFFFFYFFCCPPEMSLLALFLISRGTLYSTKIETIMSISCLIKQTIKHINIQSVMITTTNSTRKIYI